MGAFERTEIDIRGYDGIYRVPAYRSGVFAVHQHMQRNGLYSMEWGITHVPSGIGMGVYFPTREAAESATLEIAALRDWETFHPRNDMTPKLKSDVRAIFTRHGGERGERSAIDHERAIKEFATDLNGYGTQIPDGEGF